MANTKFSTSSINQGLVKSRSMLVGNAAYISDFESIATVTVGAGGAANVEFTSISAAYTDLQIRVTLRSTSSAATGALGSRITFNGDTTSNYAAHALSLNGVTNPGSPTIASTGSTTQTSAGAGPILVLSTALTSAFSVGIVDILDYKSTNKNKTIRTLTGGNVNNDGGWISFYSGLWYKTPEAITSIKFTPTSDNYAQYSQFALYGIKGA